MERPVAEIVNFNDKQNGAARPSIEPLLKLVGDDMAEVNRAILDRMGGKVPLIPQLAGHIIAAGGKRIRPMLTLAAARLCGYTGKRQIGLAACVEFIHTATLLHDDVVDESDLRRGVATANVVWSNQASVLVGDYLFSRAFQIMVEDGSLEVLRILADASAIIAEGEVMQLETSNDTTTSEESYLEVISSKTAALFAAASRVGAVVAERPHAEEMALNSFGRNLGIAFQLVDDLLDYSASQEELGKTVGDDFREGKVTLPVILAFRRGDDEERDFWRRCIEKGDQQDGDFHHAVQLMERREALSDTLERARHYSSIARDALGLFSDNEIKRALLEMVDFGIERAY
jgi:octaprenyl-diphosphate synthase